MRLIDDLRQKYPKLARSALRGALPAIRLFCLECMGGSPSEVGACAAAECALHPHRYGKRQPVKGA